MRRIQLDQVILDLLKQTRAHQLKCRAHYGELYTSNYLNATDRMEAESVRIMKKMYGAEG